jgi:hypothetical protein
MTDIDTAVIRIGLRDPLPEHWTGPRTILELCDALDAARAERDDIQTGARQWADWAMQHEARAEAAERRIANWQIMHADVRAQLDAAEARIAAACVILTAIHPEVRTEA